MPTDVSTPIWRCDLCGHRFGEHHDAAQRCESAPLPVELPEGTPLLVVRAQHFSLAPLSATGGIDTAASEWNDTRGHSRRYRYGTGTTEITDRFMVPAAPGYLQVPANRYGHLHIHTVPAQVGARFNEFARLAGLGQPRSPVRTGVDVSDWTQDLDPRWVRPISPSVRAAMDLLHARPAVGSRYDDWYAQRTRARYVARVGGSHARARMLLSCANTTDLDFEALELQRDWLGGEPVSAPAVRLVAGRDLTPSKLSKAQKQLIDATGVPWRPRTNSTEYLNTLIKEALMDDAHITRDLFPGPKVIAVGGVKGGVGKSTVAGALAAALAQSGHRTTLLDMDLDGPSQHLLWGLGPVPVDGTLTRLLPSATSVPGLRVFSSGQIGGGLPTSWDEAMTREWVQFVGTALDVADDEFLVVDLPAGEGTAAEQFLSDSSTARRAVCYVVVTSADPLALSDASRALARAGRPRTTVVENLSTVAGVVSTGETVQVRLRGQDGSVAAVAEAAKATYGGSLPWMTGESPVTDLAVSAEMRRLVDVVLAGVSPGLA